MACRDEGAHRVDVDSGLVHSVVGTAANVQNLTPVACRLHGPEMHVHANAGDTGRSIRTHCRAEVAEHVAVRPGQRRQLNRRTEMDGRLNASFREHASPFGKERIPRSTSAHPSTDLLAVNFNRRSEPGTFELALPYQLDMTLD